MIREWGAWVHASRTAPATFSGSSIFDWLTLSCVRPSPRANSVFTPPGQITPTLIPWVRSSLSSAWAKPTCANFVAQYAASPAIEVLKLLLDLFFTLLDFKLTGIVEFDRSF